MILADRLPHDARERKPRASGDDPVEIAKAIKE